MSRLVPEQGQAYYLQQLARCQALLKNELDPRMREMLESMARQYRELARAGSQQS